jgi:hypothetical protein
MTKKTKALLEYLAEEWRKAENAFIESDYTDESWKTEVWDKQIACNLTKAETKYLEELCQSMGI